MPGAFAHMVAADRAKQAAGKLEVSETNKFPAVQLMYVPFPKNDQQDILNIKTSQGDGQSS